MTAKRKTPEADRLDEDVKVLEQETDEVLEADQAQEPEPAYQVVAASEPGQFTDTDLGLPAAGKDGEPLTPEEREAAYNEPSLAWCKDLAVRVGVVDETLLWNIAASFRATQSTTWREALLSQLRRREMDPLGAMTSDELMARGLVRNLDAQLDYLHKRLGVVLDGIKPAARRVRALERAIYAAHRVANGEE